MVVVGAFFAFLGNVSPAAVLSLVCVALRCADDLDGVYDVAFVFCLLDLGGAFIGPLARGSASIEAVLGIGGFSISGRFARLVAFGLGIIWLVLGWGDRSGAMIVRRWT